MNDRLTIRDKVYYTDLKWDSDGSLINGAFPSPVGFLVARSLVMLDDRQNFSATRPRRRSPSRPAAWPTPCSAASRSAA